MIEQDGKQKTRQEHARANTHVPDTIFALSTPSGRSGVAVIRVSGIESYNSAKVLTNKEIKARTPLLCALKNPATGAVIDHALVLGFKAPASFTGENVIEYQIHGSRAVIAEMMDVLGAQAHHRLAEPGEFTRRAFENDKLDLTQAEAVADLIDAETQAQKAQALAQMGGALSGLYNGWTERLKKALAHLEADIEFPDEDLPGGIAPQITQATRDISREIGEHLSDNRRGERLRDGIHIAVIGAPNAGKSSLVNVLAQRDVAIVSDIAGTTRDIIEVHLDVGGYPVILSDTAGLRPDQIGTQGQDSIESEGIRRALDRARAADIRLLVFDGAASMPDQHTLDLLEENAIVVVNKADSNPSLREGREADAAIQYFGRSLDCFTQPVPAKAGARNDVILTSAKTGAGLDALLAAITEKAAALVGHAETPSLTRRRHRAALEESRIALNRALAASLPELMAEDLRLAVRAIGRITGRVDVEDLLDVIFRDFCIGK